MHVALKIKGSDTRQYARYFSGIRGWPSLKGWVKATIYFSGALTLSWPWVVWESFMRSILFLILYHGSFLSDLHKVSWTSRHRAFLSNILVFYWNIDVGAWSGSILAFDVMITSIKATTPSITRFTYLSVWTVSIPSFDAVIDKI